MSYSMKSSTSSRILTQNILGFKKIYFFKFYFATQCSTDLQKVERFYEMQSAAE